MVFGGFSIFMLVFGGVNQNKKKHGFFGHFVDSGKEPFGREVAKKHVIFRAPAKPRTGDETRMNEVGGKS